MSELVKPYGDFPYKHDNPYHEKLELFNDFVLRDTEGEAFKGKWNETVFQRHSPLVLEIGSGFGEFMVEYCDKHPELNFIGLDHRFKRSFFIAKKLSKLESSFCSFRFLRARAERLDYLFAENELDTVMLFFSDPWPKKKHHKRRIVNQAFIEQLYKLLKPSGELWIKTDHDEYAEVMRELFEAQPYFTITYQSADLWAEEKQTELHSFQTKFEKMFISQNTKIKAFILKSKKCER